MAEQIREIDPWDHLRFLITNHMKGSRQGETLATMLRLQRDVSGVMMQALELLKIAHMNVTHGPMALVRDLEQCIQDGEARQIPLIKALAVVVGQCQNAWGVTIENNSGEEQETESTPEGS